MPIKRRQLLALAALSPLATPRAHATSYPTKPVRLLVGFPPGGTADAAARIIAHALTERLSQPFIVENRPGAGTNIATEAVARAPADGHTLLLITTSNLLNGALYDKLSFDFSRDITPVGSIFHSPLVLVATPSFPAASVPEFIAHARANPGKVNMAMFGNGTIGHVATELLKQMAGIDTLHLPYNGSAPMHLDLLAGHTQIAFDVLPASIGHIRAGKLRALAVTTATRSDMLPETPTLSSFLPGYEIAPGSGLGAPKATPAEVISKLNQHINAALADPTIKARIAALGATAQPSTPDDYAQFVAGEIQKWGKVIKSSGMKIS